MHLPDAPPPYATVVFDCDSTLAAIEGISQLATPEHAAELARLTDRAMEGELSLEEVYARRLELARPTRGRVLALGERYVETRVPGAVELVGALLELGKRLAIVSGGLRPAVERLARSLGIEEVHAVDVWFDQAGDYLGFDEASPLAAAGGKPRVLDAIGRDPRARPIALVGDGTTDLEAAPRIARFIAYGGVVRREAVFRRARVARSDPDLRALVPLLLSPSEIETLRSHPAHRTLFDTSPR